MGSLFEKTRAVSMSVVSIVTVATYQHLKLSWVSQNQVTTTLYCFTPVKFRVIECSCCICNDAIVLLLV